MVEDGSAPTDSCFRQVHRHRCWKSLWLPHAGSEGRAQSPRAEAPTWNQALAARSVCISHGVPPWPERLKESRSHEGKAACPQRLGQGEACRWGRPLGGPLSSRGRLLSGLGVSRNVLPAGGRHAARSQRCPKTGAPTSGRSGDAVDLGLWTVKAPRTASGLPQSSSCPGTRLPSCGAIAVPSSPGPGQGPQDHETEEMASCVLVPH